MVTGPTALPAEHAQSIALFLQLAFFPWCTWGHVFLRHVTHTPDHPGDVEDRGHRGNPDCSAANLRCSVYLEPFYQNQHDLL